MPERTLKSPPRINAAWFIVPCLACDFLMVPAVRLMDGGPGPHEISAAIAFGIVGCVLAQGCLLAAWLAWSEGPFRRRLLTHWKIATGLYLIWVVGAVSALWQDRAAPHVAATVFLGVPLVSVAAQLPLWLARHWWAWRLVREPSETADSSEPKLAIRDLMVATVIVAVSLALARLAPADGQDVWPVWGIGFAFASVISSITMLPAGKLLMRSQDFRRGLRWSVLYAAAWIALVWIVVAILRWGFAVNLPPRAIFVGLSSLMLTFAATVILTAIIARDRGYRLAAKSRKPKAAS